jgi:hypothetical protein
VSDSAAAVAVRELLSLCSAAEVDLLFTRGRSLQVVAAVAADAADAVANATLEL